MKVRVEIVLVEILRLESGNLILRRTLKDFVMFMIQIVNVVLREKCNIFKDFKEINS